MDNNFNQQSQGQPMYQQPQGQPVYQQPQGQPVYQQPQGQPVYQQPQAQPMYQQPQGQPMYQQPPKKPLQINWFEVSGLICSILGLIMSVLGSSLTCACSASKTFDPERVIKVADNTFVTSPVLVVSIIGAVFAIAGIVLAIVALKKQSAVKAGKIAYIAIVVGAVAFMYGVLPVMTICGYNCSLNSEYAG